MRTEQIKVCMSNLFQWGKGSYLSRQKQTATVNLIFTDVSQNLAKSIFRAEVKQMASSFPPIFHKAMIPDLRSADDDCHVDAEQKALEEQELSSWQSKLDLFRCQLKSDQKMVTNVAAGHRILADRLDWARHMKRAAEIDKATSLVSQYMAWYHPVLECKSLQDAAAWYLKCDAVTCLQESFLGCWEVSLSLEIHSDAQASKVPLCPPPPSGSAFVSDDTKFQHLTLLRIDLNVPNVSRPKLVPLKQATGAKRERERERTREREREREKQKEKDTVTVAGA